MGSFFFYFVVSQTALDKNGTLAKTSFPAIPIGFSLVVVNICLIPFTGCGVNPARTFGPAMVTCMSPDGNCEGAVGDWWWIYFVGPFVAAFLVAEITALINWDVEDEKKYEVAANKADGGAEE
jgi:glycerol uptake facilitator-like aquaporin